MGVRSVSKQESILFCECHFVVDTFTEPFILHCNLHTGLQHKGGCVNQSSHDKINLLCTLYASTRVWDSQERTNNSDGLITASPSTHYQKADWEKELQFLELNYMGKKDKE